MNSRRITQGIRWLLAPALLAVALTVPGLVVSAGAGQDKNPPQTRITGGPKDNAKIDDTTPRFSFKSTEKKSTFECSVDQANFTPCTSPLTLGPLAGGKHSFEARATDAAGNTDPSPAKVTFTVSVVASTCAGRQATLTGTNKPDTLTGTAGPDVIVAGDGDDTIAGLQGDDVICGGDGGDQVQAGIGADYVEGDSGRDRLGSGGGADNVQANSGNDQIGGGNGGDVLNGGTGNDDISGFGGPDTLAGYLGNDVCRGGPGRDHGKGCEQRVGIP